MKLSGFLNLRGISGQIAALVIASIAAIHLIITASFLINRPDRPDPSNDRGHAQLATAALQVAIAVRGGGVTGVVFHSDQGGEYTGELFAAACARAGVRQSMGRTGSALDNAVAESFNSTLEFELLAHNHFRTRAQARAAVAAWLEEYNTIRLHSTVGMLPPAVYEARARREAA